MKRHLLTALFAVAIGTIAINTAHAQIPRTISFQGVLADAAGNLVPDGPTTLNVSIYDVPTGGTPLFSETLPVIVVNGVFNAILGSSGGAGLPAGIAFDKQYHLGVQVAGGIEIAPRTAFTSVPYALNAAVAQRAMTADHATEADSAGKAATAKIADAITGGHVASLNGQQGAVEILGAGATTVTRVGNQFIIRSSDTSGGAIRRIDNFDGSLVIDPPTGPFVTMFIRAEGIQTHHYRDLSITTQKIIDEAITLPKIEDAGASNLQAISYIGGEVVWGNPSPGGPAGGDLTGTYPNPVIAPNAVTSPKILDGTILTQDLADNAITSPKILDGTILTQDLADNSVTSPKILDGTIITADLANNSVTSAKIVDGTIITADLADNSVTSAKIVDGTIVTVDLADNSVTSPKIVDGQVMTVDLADGSVTNPKLAPNAVTTDKILDLTILTADIADAQITNPKLAPNAVTTDKILDGTIISADLADGSVTNPKLAPNAVTTDKILDGTIITADLADGSVTNPKLAPNAVTTDKILDLTIITADLADGSVTSAKIADGTIVTADLADNSVTSPKIVDGQVMTVDLADGSVTNPKLAPNAVTTDKILDLTILTADIADAQITNPKLAPNAVTTDKILDGTIITADLADASVTNPKLAPNAVTTDKILDGTIITADLADASVTNPKLAPNAVTTDKILDGTIITADLADGSVTNPKLAPNAVTTDKILDLTIATADVANNAIVAAKIGTAAAGGPFPSAGSFLQSNGTITPIWSADGSQITDINASNITSGTLNDARLSPNVPLKNANNVFTGTNTFGTVFGTTFNGGTFNGTFFGTHIGDGAGLTNLNATNIASGTLNDLRLSPNVPLKNAANIFTNTNTFTTVNGTTFNGTTFNGTTFNGGTFNGTFVGTFSGDGSGLTNLNASNITTGTLNDLRLSSNVPLKNAANVFTNTNTFTTVNGVTFNGTTFTGTNFNGGTFTGTHVGDGSALANLNASNITTGTLNDLRLSSNVPLKNANNVFTGTNTFGTVFGTTFNGGTFNGTFVGTFSGDGSGLTNLNASNITTGTLNDLRLSSNVPLKNAANIFTNTNTFTTVNGTTFNGGTFNGMFVGDGAGLTNLNATNITTGTLNDLRLSSNVPLKNAANTFTNTNTFGTVFGTTFNGGTFNGTFVGNGAGVTAINATNITTGTLNDLRLSSNVPLKNAANTFTNTNTFTTVNGTAFNGGTFNGTAFTGGTFNGTSFTGGTFSGNGAALTNLNADNIATGTLDLARIDPTGALAGQSVSFDGVNVVWGGGGAASTLVMPFSQTANEPTRMFTLTNSNAVAGEVARFAASNAANTGDALEAETAGLGRAAVVSVTNALNAANALEVTTTGTGAALSITSGAGGTGVAIEVNRGALIGSYTTMASGGTVPADYMFVFVLDDNGNSSAIATLPAVATDGQVIIMGTNDPHGLNVNGLGITSSLNTRRWVYMGGVWKREF